MREDQRVESDNLALIYMDVKRLLIEWGYADEIDWCADLEFGNITETEFLGEAAWVVLSSGFRESVVRGVFPAVSEAFMEWCSARDISKHRERCERRALEVFRNRRKICAIGKIVGCVAELGFEQVKVDVLRVGVDWMRRLPFMGPATSLHFARNLGIPVVKPDRHLVRIAMQVGRDSPAAMCSEISAIVGDTVGVVDLVLWRYATLDRDYWRLFAGGGRARIESHETQRRHTALWFALGREKLEADAYE